MFSKLKSKAKDKSEEVIEEHIPKIKSLLKDKVGIKAKDAFENDELMTKALSRVYDLLVISHPTVRFIIKRERFISFGLSNRNRLIDWRDTRSLPALPEQQLEEGEPHSKEKEASMPRDYIKEASSTIFGDKVPLAELVEADPGQAIGNLLRALNHEQGLSSTMIRKSAAYALGQVGEAATLDHLRERYENEQAAGVKEALLASMTAIKLAPAGAGHSQLDRRQIIEDVYEGRRQADWL